MVPSERAIYGLRAGKLFETQIDSDDHAVFRAAVNAITAELADDEERTARADLEDLIDAIERGELRLRTRRR